MQQTDEMRSKNSTLGRYVLVKTLGKGYNSKVKLSFDPSNSTYYAIKTIKHSHPKLSLKNIRVEIDALNNLRHPNLINLIEFHESIDYIKKDGTSYKVIALVLELIPGGELFEHIAGSGRFKEEIARTYFKTLIETIEYCHNQGVVHRDLKAENLLIDGNFNLRVADFGFASLTTGKDNSGQLHTRLGTESYMAPELHLRQPYSGPSVDLFACAVILFIMVSGNPPFLKADPASDAHYKLLCINRPDAFWEAHERGKPKEAGKSFFNENFRHMLSAMLALDPALRLSIEEIKAHPWYKGDCMTTEQIQTELLSKKEAVDTFIKKQRAARKEKKIEERTTQAESFFVASSIKANDQRPFRSIESAKESDKNGPSAKTESVGFRVLKQYQGQIGLKSTSEFFTCIEPEILLNNLALAVHTTLNEFTVSNDAFKIKGRAVTEEGSCSLNIVITKVDEIMYCVEFHRLQGNIWVFYKIIEELKKFLNLEQVKEDKLTEAMNELQVK